jgi:hypothetical protein
MLLDCANTLSIALLDVGHAVVLTPDIGSLAIVLEFAMNFNNNWEYFIIAL